MNRTFCIDKRIGYLALFAVPLMALTIFSLMVNSQKVTQNSRASESAKMPAFEVVITPTPILSSTICSQINQNIKPTYASMPMRVYGRSNGVMIMVTLIPPSSENTLVILAKSILSSLESNILIGVQGEMTETALAKAFNDCNLR